MADTLLTPSVHLGLIKTWLDGVLPSAVVVVIDEPPANGPTPFVVISGYLSAQRVSLGNTWSMAELIVVAESVHDTKVQAQALGSLVRTAFLTGSIPIPGLIEVDLHDVGVLDAPAGVPQVRESWALQLQRV